MGVWPVSGIYVSSESVAGYRNHSRKAVSYFKRLRLQGSGDCKLCVYMGPKACPRHPYIESLLTL